MFTHNHSVSSSPQHLEATKHREEHTWYFAGHRTETLCFSSLLPTPAPNFHLIPFYDYDLFELIGTEPRSCPRRVTYGGYGGERGSYYGHSGEKGWRQGKSRERHLYRFVLKCFRWVSYAVNYIVFAILGMSYFFHISPNSSYTA